jgi:hypothetical protein
MKFEHSLMEIDGRTRTNKNPYIYMKNLTDVAIEHKRRTRTRKEEEEKAMKKQERTVWACAWGDAVEKTRTTDLQAGDDCHTWGGG